MGLIEVKLIFDGGNGGPPPLASGKGGIGMELLSLSAIKLVSSCLVGSLRSEVTWFKIFLMALNFPLGVFLGL